MQLRRGSLFGRVSQGLWGFPLWCLQRDSGGVIGSPLIVCALLLLTRHTHTRSHMHTPLVTTLEQLPILAVLLFSTLCLFLVAEAKDLYKVRGV